MHSPLTIYTFSFHAPQHLTTQKYNPCRVLFTVLDMQHQCNAWLLHIAHQVSCTEPTQVFMHEVLCTACTDKMHVVHAIVYTETFFAR